jgi:hypothetical protein
MLYIDENISFRLFGWHHTLTGSTVYSSHSLSSLANLSFTESSNFPHINIIYNSLIQNSKYFWINHEYLLGHTKKISYWKNNIFETFIDDWHQVIMQLPIEYSNKDKEKVIEDHWLKTNIFNLRSFLMFRLNRYYNYKQYKKYKNYFKKYSKINIIILFSISIIPLYPIFVFQKFYKFIKR